MLKLPVILIGSLSSALFIRLQNQFNKRAQSALTCVFCTVLFCYFSYHIYQGNYGLNARSDLARKTVKLHTELATLQQTSQKLTHHIALLKSPLQQGENIADLSEELARQTLQLSYPDEIVLFDVTQDLYFK